MLGALEVDNELEQAEVVRLPHRTPVRYGAGMGENLAAEALQRVDELEAALEPLGLAEAHRPKVLRRPLSGRGVGAHPGRAGGRQLTTAG